MKIRFLKRTIVFLFVFIISGKYSGAQISTAEFEEMKQKIETQKSEIELLGNRLNTTSSDLKRETSRYAPMFMVLFLYGAFCALWAQNTGRNPWSWFFLGLFLSVLTVMILLAIDSRDTNI